jgi:hypothetical protein
MRHSHPVGAGPRRRQRSDPRAHPRMAWRHRAIDLRALGCIPSRRIGDLSRARHPCGGNIGGNSGPSVPKASIPAAARRMPSPLCHSGIVLLLAPMPPVEPQASIWIWLLVDQRDCHRDWHRAIRGFMICSLSASAPHHPAPHHPALPCCAVPFAVAVVLCRRLALCRYLACTIIMRCCRLALLSGGRNSLSLSLPGAVACHSHR